MISTKPSKTSAAPVATDPRTLTREEVSSLQARAAKGELPSLDEIRDFIHTTRVSFLANAAAQKSAAKSRVKKPPVDESQIDFF